MLEANHNLPINLELRILENLQGVEEYRSGLVSQEKWQEDRANRVRLFYRLWNKLQQNIDREFDVKYIKNRPIGNVPVPGPYMAGIRSEDVKEPDIRAKYLEAIAANRAKAEKFNLQIQLQKLDKKFSEFVERIFVDFYTIEPRNSDELAANLRLFELNDLTKQRIIDKINANFLNRE